MSDSLVSFWFVLRTVPAAELLWADTLQQQTGDAKILEWYLCKEDAADRDVNPVGVRMHCPWHVEHIPVSTATSLAAA